MKFLIIFKMDNFRKDDTVLKNKIQEYAEDEKNSKVVFITENFQSVPSVHDGTSNVLDYIERNVPFNNRITSIFKLSLIHGSLGFYGYPEKIEIIGDFTEELVSLGICLKMKYTDVTEVVINNSYKTQEISVTDILDKLNIKLEGKE